jgi:hypothetical protein
LAFAFALGVAIALNQRHQKDLVATLTALIGDRLIMAISSGGTRVVPVVRFVGVIDAVDPSTRWIRFRWVECDEVEGFAADLAASLLPNLAENGLIADRIYWVEDDAWRRTRLT